MKDEPMKITNIEDMDLSSTAQMILDIIEEHNNRMFQDILVMDMLEKICIDMGESIDNKIDEAYQRRISPSMTEAEKKFKAE